MKERHRFYAFISAAGFFMAILILSTIPLSRTQLIIFSIMAVYNLSGIHFNYLAMKKADSNSSL